MYVGLYLHRKHNCEKILQFLKVKKKRLVIIKNCSINTVKHLKKII